MKSAFYSFEPAFQSLLIKSEMSIITEQQTVTRIKLPKIELLDFI